MSTYLSIRFSSSSLGEILQCLLNIHSVTLQPCKIIVEDKQFICGVAFKFIVALHAQHGNRAAWFMLPPSRRR